MFSNTRSAVFVVNAVLFLSLNSGVVLGQQAAGKTIMVRGAVLAISSEDSRQLRRRSPIYDVDVVETGANSNTQLRMVDGGLLSLKEDSQLNIANYEYNAATGEGAVAMELVKGGLRSITGALNKAGTNYQLNTPVASIGVRGTHFEIELVGSELFVAVWDGAIDLTAGADGSGDVVSFGEGEDFSFGIVTEEGEVTPLLEAPENFNQGHSDDSTDDEEDSQEDDSNSNSDNSNNSTNDNNNVEPASDSEESDSSGGSEESQGTDSDNDNGGSEDTSNDSSSNSDSNSSDSSESGRGESGQGSPSNNEGGGLGGGAGAPPPPPPPPGNDDSGVPSTGVEDVNSDEFIDNDIVNDDLVTDPDEVVIRSGVATFNQLAQQSITSSQGGVSNVQASITVDFDTARIPEGSISFEDSGGEWFAAFNGVIATPDSLDLSVNFAAHGDNLATGDISGFLIEDATGILGNINLFEVSNPNTNAGGSFLLREP